jgi:hypothetical protein
MQLLSGSSPLRLATIFYCLRFETYFSSPPSALRATVRIFVPASTLEPPFRDYMNQKAEEQTFLEAVNRKRLVKTLHAGKSVCSSEL